MNDALVRRKAPTAPASPLRGRYGDWAMVTGASDGIGREFAMLLARSGLNLVLVARRASVLETLARELAQASGVEVKVIQLISRLRTECGP